jgi:hypothetical protein
LPMQCAIWDFKSVNGLVTPQVAVIDSPVTLILTDGSVNMGREQLNLRFVAKPKNVSPFTVRSPILITGTFANPKVRPKAEPIAARVLGGIALAFINPLAALLPFIDPGSGDESPCGQALREFKAGDTKSGDGKADGKSPAVSLKKDAEDSKARQRKDNDRKDNARNPDERENVEVSPSDTPFPGRD